MRTLRGQVTCNKEDAEINPEAVIGVEIRDVSLMDVASKLIARTELKGITKFPFDYSLDYDEAPLVGKPPHFFSLDVAIQTGGQLDYITDTRFNVIDNNRVLLDTVNVYVKPVEKFPFDN